MDASIPTLPANPLAPFVETIRSDELPKLSVVLRQIRLFAGIADLLQVNVILDANVVIRELLWLAKKRTNPRARPEVLELIECEIVRAHAPTFLIQEIEKKIPTIAKQRKVTEESLRDHWRKYRERIQFTEVGGPIGSFTTRDPKDTPYLRLQEKLGVPIASNDLDLPAMGGRMIQVQVFGSLKKYSRNTAVEYHLKVLGFGSAVAFVGLASLLMRGVKGVSIQIGKIPKPVVCIGVALLVIALLHPASRKKIFEVLDRLIVGSATAFEAGVAGLYPLIEEHYRAQASANQGLADAKTLLEAKER